MGREKKIGALTLNYLKSFVNEDIIHLCHHGGTRNQGQNIHEIS